MHAVYETDLLWDAWQKLKNKHDNLILAKTKQAACVELKTRAARFARLGSLDETAYKCLLSFAGLYSHITTQFEELEPENPDAKTLLSGISEVLIARRNELTDSLPPDYTTCPILQEKCEIIYQTQLQLLDDFDFEKHLKTCLAKLGDLSTRPLAAYVIEQLPREREELGNIIKLQVKALEPLLGESDGCVFTLLDFLRQLYQETGPVVDGINSILTSPPPEADYAFDAPPPDEIETALPEETAQFLELLAEPVNLIFNNLQSDRSAPLQEASYNFAQDFNLTEEVQLIFRKLSYTLAETEEENDTIFPAIIETLNIKTESLQENISYLQQEVTGLLEDFLSEKLTPTDRELKTAIDFLFAKFKDAPQLDLQPSCLGLETAEEVFLPFRSKVEKHATNFTEKISKLLFRFKKETLLYEVCTYEEILRHSVPLLTNSAPIFYETFSKLQELLVSRGVSPITPQPHEMFSAQEHDVLIAEVHEGFNKGEIVKTLTTGYKQHGKVIIRAGVIAAR